MCVLDNSQYAFRADWKSLASLDGRRSLGLKLNVENEATSHPKGMQMPEKQVQEEVLRMLPNGSLLLREVRVHWLRKSTHRRESWWLQA